MVIFQKDYVTITLIEEKGYLYQEWSGFCSSSSFRAAIDLSMETLKKNNCHKIISDIREQKVVPPRDQEYVKMKMMEFKKTDNLIKMAFIARKKSVIRTCARLYTRSLPGEQRDSMSMIFETFDDALSWIAKE